MGGVVAIGLVDDENDVRMAIYGLEQEVFVSDLSGRVIGVAEPYGLRVSGNTRQVADKRNLMAIDTASVLIFAECRAYDG